MGKDKAQTIINTKTLIKDAEEFLKSIEAGDGGPGAEVDRRAKALLARGSVKLYSEALDRVLEDDPALAKTYADGPFADDDARSVGEAIDLRVKEMMRADSTLDYQSALDRTLEANPDLARAYGRGRAAAA